MERFPVELLVYGAIFLLILAFNYLSRRMQSRKPAPEGEHEPAAQEQPLPEYRAAPEFWGRVPPAETLLAVPVPPARHVERVPPAAVQRAPRRYTRRSLLGSKQDLRRAIVLMTVLGPCRGAESSEDSMRRQSPASRG